MTAAFLRGRAHHLGDGSERGGMTHRADGYRSVISCDAILVERYRAFELPDVLADFEVVSDGGGHADSQPLIGGQRSAQEAQWLSIHVRGWVAVPRLLVSARTALLQMGACSGAWLCCVTLAASSKLAHPKILQAAPAPDWHTHA